MAQSTSEKIPNKQIVTAESINWETDEGDINTNALHERLPPSTDPLVLAGFTSDKTQESTMVDLLN